MSECYDDCPLIDEDDCENSPLSGTCSEVIEWFAKHDAKVRADAIKEFVERMKKHKYASAEGREYAILIAEIVAYELKEQNIK